jgi:C_GCAxxG_C_C family probable redox protein
MATGNLLGREDKGLLTAATSLGGGIGHEGDTCGALTGGILALGRRHLSGSQEIFYEEGRRFYQKFVRCYGSGKCRDIIGIRLKEGKNIRRLLYKGMICMGVVSNSIGWIFDIQRQQDLEGQRDVFDTEIGSIQPSETINCPGLVLKEFRTHSSIDTTYLNTLLSGFSGGIAFQGDVCGALMAGIVILGLIYGNNPQTHRQTGKRLLKSGWQIMRQGNKAFEHEGLHPSFAASQRAALLYRDFVSQFKSADCKDIRKGCTCSQNLKDCQYVAKYVAHVTRNILETNPL